MRSRQYVAPVACDACGAMADTAHLLPDDLHPREVRFACSEHDPGGDWFSIRRDGLPVDEWILHRLAEKNADSLIIYMRRIQQEQGRSRSQWRDALDRIVSADRRQFARR
jgi:hypothetical protein